MTFLIHNLDYFIPLSLSLVFKGNTEVTKSLADCVIVGNTLSTHLSGSERSALGQTAYITLEVSSANGYATTQMIKGDLDRLENGSQVAPTLELSPSTPIVGKNLLINPFFTVNQRGQNSYTLANQYGFDCWQGRVGYAPTKLKIEKVSNGIKISCIDGSNFPLLVQHIENVEAIRGKTITFSVNIKEFSGPRCRLQIAVDGTNYTILLSVGIVSVSATVPSNANQVLCRIILNNSDADDATSAYIIYDGTKLEEGSISTLMYEEPRLYADELRLCQRYLTKLKASVENGVFALGAGTSGGGSASYVLPLPVEMRTVTAVTYNSLKVTDKGNGGSASRTVSSVAVQSSNGNSVCLRVGASGIIANGLSLLVADTADDNYIMLTAEM